jgi:hypothetical protein
METSLFQEIFSALMSTIIVPLLLLLLLSIIIYDHVRMSRIELDFEKDLVKSKIRMFISSKGFTYERDTVPYIQRDHVDGPYIYTIVGSVHWLTYIDRFLLWARFSSVDKLDIKYCKEMMKSSKRFLLASKSHLRKKKWVVQLI